MIEAEKSRRRLLMAIILVVGLLILAIGILVKDRKTSSIMLGVGAGMVALTLVRLLNVFGGGEPTEMSVKQLIARVEDIAKPTETSVKELIARVDDIAKTLNEQRSPEQALLDSHAWVAELGVTCMYRYREAVNGQSRWLERAGTATHIDLMGLTMWDEWLRHEPLVECLRVVARRSGTSVRILVLALDNARPDSTFQDLGGPDMAVHVRARQPGEQEAKVLWDFLGYAHGKLGPLRDELKGENFEVRQMRVNADPYGLIVRINEYMMVAPYLSSAQGKESFAMELAPGPLFDTYLKEFEQAFKAEADNERPSV